METNDSVPKEQFNDEEEVIENADKKTKEAKGTKKKKVESSKKDKDSKKDKVPDKKEKVSKKAKTDTSSSTETVASDKEEDSKEVTNTKKSEETTAEDKKTTKKEKKETSTDEKKDKKSVKKSETSKTLDDTSKEESKEKESKEAESVDYNFCSKTELIAHLTNLLDTTPVQNIRAEVDSIKINFYKKHKVELEKKKRKFIDEGGELEDFRLEPDSLENDLKDLLKRYRDLKAKYNSDLEVQKQENLKMKYEIIEEIKNLVNRKESINKTFQEFRELQNQWRDIGIVPQQNVKDLWETYHLHVAKFYDHIKINKELRDLDLKKNLEEKISLCEKAEELLLEPSIIKAFSALQNLHAQWREIGPVPNEMKDPIWERFKAATTKINKKHQEHFEHIKEEQKKNLESKTLLCEQAEEIANTEISGHKEWEAKSKELIELQKVWRTIGFAPKKDNNRIYKRFRDACDQFFARKRDFYAENKEIQDANLQIKTDYCIQAEALKDSREWKKTTEDLIELQKKWKSVGPVPKKHSDQIWKRFRTACDYFFEQKSKYYENIDTQYDDNLKKKEELIKKIKEYKIDNENVEESFEKLKVFQKDWTEIGFVPIKKKDEIQDKYRKALQEKFDNIEVDEQRKSLLRYKSKIDEITHKPKSGRRLKQEREGFINKIKKLENDIVLWENNIGFFIKSKNADAMIKEVQDKIDNAKEKIQVLEEKIKLIDSIE